MPARKPKKPRKPTPYDEAIEAVRAGRGCVYAEQTVPAPSTPLSVRAAREWIAEHVEVPAPGFERTVGAERQILVRVTAATYEAVEAAAAEHELTIAAEVRAVLERTYGS